MSGYLQSFFTKKTNVRVLTILLSILIIITGFFNYRHEHRTIHRTQEQFLQSVANLKANQISAWYADEIRDAEIIANNFFLLENIQKWQADPSSVNRQWLLRYLTTVIDLHDYKDLLLISAEGRLLLALDPEITQLDSSLVRNIRRAVAADSLIVTDFYHCPVHQKIRMDIIRPLKIANNMDIVLVFKLDPEMFIFPLFRSWLVPSKSAETLIVRQEGDSVLFINELRHRADTALNLKISLKELDVPAVQAVRGFRGIWSGLDYRGAKVLADVRPISGTPWFMVAKIDRSELFAELRSKAFYTILFIFFLVLFVAAGLGLVYYLKQRDVYRQLYRSRQEFRTTLYSIGDAVITTDIRGKIKYLNPVAEELTGWRERQVEGKPLRRVFKIINEETRQNAENPVERVLREGLVVGLANHTLLIAKDGREVPIADSGAPIRDEDGNIIGVVLVFRDQTAERAAQKALEESEEKYRLIVENSHDGIEISQDDRIIFCNTRFAEMLGYTDDEIKNIPFSQIFTEEATRELYGRQALRRAAIALPHFYETTFYRKDHSLIDVQVSYKIIDYRGKPATFGTIRDITAQKQAQKEYQQLINGMNDTAFVISFQGKFIEVNDAAVRTLGYSRAEMLNMGPTDIDPHMSAADIGKLIEGMQTDRRQVFETQHRAKDGRIIPVEINSSQVMYKGEKAILSICRDITERKQAEKALREYTRKLEQAEEAANLGSWEYNVRDGSGWWSKQMFRMLGFEPRNEVPTFEEYLTHVHPKDREAVSEVLKNIGKGKVTVLDEYRSNPEFGPLRYFGTTALSIQDESGKTVKIIGAILDITNLKLAQEALRESEERYRLVSDKSMDAILLTKLDGTILSANKAACEMFGMTEEEICAVGRDGLVDLAELRLSELLEKRKRTGSAKGELTMIRKDGSRFPVEVSSSVFTTSKGKSRTSMIIRDITERKQAEKALEESERKLKTLMDNLQGMVYSCLNDKDWTMKFVSEGTLPLTGYSPGELIDNRVLAYNDIIHPDDRELVWSSIQEALAEREPYMLEYRIITKDGAQKWVWERGRGVFSAEGELLALEGIISDISDFKEAQEKISQLKDNLETEVAKKTRELQQRVAELERFHDATVERELRMKELRDEIGRLKAERE